MAFDSASAQIFGAIRSEYPDNVEAWFMEGEALFHYGPLRGGPFTEARTQFERVLYLDPGNPHALLHLARIAASEQQLAELDTLVRRFVVAYPDAERNVEMRALRAFASDDTTQQKALGIELRSLKDVVLDAAVANATALNENPAAATVLASAYEAPGRSLLILGRGAATFGQIPLARGIRGSSIPSPLAAVEPDWPLEARALFAANAMIPTPAVTLSALRDSISAWTPHATAGGSFFAYHTHLHAQMRSYLLGLLSVRLGDPARALEYATALEKMSEAHPDSGMGLGFARVVRAEVARTAGDLETALRHVSAFPFDRVPAVELSVFHASAHARFLRGELLTSLGREQEALSWFGSFPEPSARDVMFLAPAHLRRAEIYERLGNRRLAIVYYSRFIRLWRDCDPELRPLVARAMLALDRLKRE